MKVQATPAVLMRQGLQSDAEVAQPIATAT
jgi:hypothetical protein